MSAEVSARAARITLDSVRETEVELENVRRESQDVTEGCEPGADVVNRDECSHAPQLRQRLDELVVVLDRLVFGQLDDQPFATGVTSSKNS